MLCARSNCAGGEGRAGGLQSAWGQAPGDFHTPRSTTALRLPNLLNLSAAFPSITSAWELCSSHLLPAKPVCLEAALGQAPQVGRAVLPPGSLPWEGRDAPSPSVGRFLLYSVPPPPWPQQRQAQGRCCTVGQMQVSGLTRHAPVACATLPIPALTHGVVSVPR